MTDFFFEIGEIKPVGVDVFSSEPTVLSNGKFSLVNDETGIEVLSNQTAVITNLSDRQQVSYLLDSSGLTSKNYTGIVEFDRDSLEHRIKKISIAVNTE
jgi:hypothetical protein